MRISVRAVWLLVLVTPCFFAGPALAWLSDSPIITDPFGDITDIALHADEDEGAMYAAIRRPEMISDLGWFRSTDGGTTWVELDIIWWGSLTAGVEGTAVGYGRFLTLHQNTDDGTVRYNVQESASGQDITWGEISTEGSWIASRIVADSNDGSGSTDNFIGAAVLRNAQVNLSAVKVYRSSNAGDSWGPGTLIDFGVSGDIDSIDEIAICNSVSGYPYYHLAYERNGRIRVSRTSNGGTSWSSPLELSGPVADGTKVGVTSMGTSVLVCAETASHEVVSWVSTDHGTTWTTAVILAGPQAGPRDPVIAQHLSESVLIYRNPDGRGVVKTVFSPNAGDPNAWTSEELATVAPAQGPQAICCLGSEVAYAFKNSTAPFLPLCSRKLAAPTADTAAPPAAAGSGWELRVVPQPSSGPVTIWSKRSGAGLPATIFDSQGRLVARLDARRESPQECSYRWGGVDLNGRSVPRGRYYLRLQDGAARSGTAITITR